MRKQIKKIVELVLIMTILIMSLVACDRITSRVDELSETISDLKQDVETETESLVDNEIDEEQKQDWINEEYYYFPMDKWPDVILDGQSWEWHSWVECGYGGSVNLYSCDIMDAYVTDEEIVADMEMTAEAWMVCAELENDWYTYDNGIVMGSMMKMAFDCYDSNGNYIKTVYSDKVLVLHDITYISTTLSVPLNTCSMKPVTSYLL